MTGSAPVTGRTDSTSASDDVEPRWEDLVPGAGADRRLRRSRRQPRHGTGARRAPRHWFAALLAVVLVLGASGAGLGYAYRTWPYEVKTFFGWSGDWTGNGTGTTEIVIHPGDLGSDIAQTLAEHGVVKTQHAFYDLLLRTSPQPDFLPGTYRVPLHASSAAALAALQIGANRITEVVAIPEGSTAQQIFRIAAKSTGLPIAELQAAAKDYRSFGVPSAAPSIEGYLFPATYTFQPHTSARTVLQTMVTRMFEALQSAGVAAKDYHRVLTLAGLVQKEGNGTDDAKVARVFLNRLAAGMPLQSDATVSYGAGGTTVVPTPAEYADKNGYNTYLHTGLPIGPISNPGDTAIAAALHPVRGSWLFFVTVNLATGETVFSNTQAEHDAAAARFDAWLAANPDYAK